MRRWEHMSVHTLLREWDSTTQLWTVGAPEYRRADVDTSEYRGNAAAHLLDDLGAEGWQLVSVDAHDSGTSYWLKRLKPEEPSDPQVR